jgi:hypothetical protein
MVVIEMFEESDAPLGDAGDAMVFFSFGSRFINRNGLDIRSIQKFGSGAAGGGIKPRQPSGPPGIPIPGRVVVSSHVGHRVRPGINSRAHSPEVG